MNSEANNITDVFFYMFTLEANTPVEQIIVREDGHIHMDSDFFRVIIEEMFNADIQNTLPNFETAIETLFQQDMDVAIQESLDNYKIERKEHMVIDVESCNYDETTKTEIICSICQEIFKDKDLISVISCKHVFHTNCIKEWGHHKQECPNCRIGIPIIN
jgi:hypothetical protein